MVAALPSYANVAHKTGTLSRTASDIGYFDTTDGRTIAVAIYVTGQSNSLADEALNKRAARSKRDRRIADISRALYDGFSRCAHLAMAAIMPTPSMAVTDPVEAPSAAIRARRLRHVNKKGGTVRYRPLLLFA